MVTTAKEQASGSLGNQLVSGEKDVVEATQQQQAQPPLDKTTLISNADDGTSVSFEGERASTSPPPGQHHGDAVDVEAGERELCQQEVRCSGQRPDDQHADEDPEEEEEFRPKATMSARGVVRARRQWALRRARRREGPNEANQLELGGGSPAEVGIREAWVGTAVEAAAVSSEVGGVEGGSVRGGGRGEGEGDRRGRGGGNGVVELLVSVVCPRKGFYAIVYPMQPCDLACASCTH